MMDGWSWGFEHWLFGVSYWVLVILAIVMLIRYFIGK